MKEFSNSQRAETIMIWMMKRRCPSNHRKFLSTEENAAASGKYTNVCVISFSIFLSRISGRTDQFVEPFYLGNGYTVKPARDRICVRLKSVKGRIKTLSIKQFCQLMRDGKPLINQKSELIP